MSCIPEHCEEVNNLNVEIMELEQELNATNKNIKTLRDILHQLRYGIFQDVKEVESILDDALESIGGK